MPPAPMYLQTLWRYTNAVIIITIMKRMCGWTCWSSLIAIR